VTDRPAWTADEANAVRAAARPWWWAAGATVLATAAAVAVVAVVSDGSDAPAHHHHDMAMDSPAIRCRQRVLSTERLMDWAVLDGQSVVAAGHPGHGTGPSTDTRTINVR